MRLVRTGFTLDEVTYHLTIDQVALFSEVVIKIDNQDLIRLALGVRVGNNADKNGWRQFVNELERPSVGEDEVEVHNIEDLRRALRGS